MSIIFPDIQWEVEKNHKLVDIKGHDRGGARWRKSRDSKGHDLRYKFLPSLQNNLVYFDLCLGKE